MPLSQVPLEVAQLDQQTPQGTVQYEYGPGGQVLRKTEVITEKGKKRDVTTTHVTEFAPPPPPLPSPTPRTGMEFYGVDRGTGQTLAETIPAALGFAVGMIGYGAFQKPPDSHDTTVLSNEAQGGTSNSESNPTLSNSNRGGDQPSTNINTAEATARARARAIAK